MSKVVPLVPDPRQCDPTIDRRALSPPTSSFLAFLSLIGAVMSAIIAVIFYNKLVREEKPRGATGSTGATGRGDDNMEPVRIGFDAGENSQSSFAIALGYNAGQNNQGPGAIAIGASAGLNSQETDAIAIGHGAGSASQPEGTICLGAMSDIVGSELLSLRSSTRSYIAGAPMTFTHKLLISVNGQVFEIGLNQV